MRHLSSFRFSRLLAISASFLLALPAFTVLAHADSEVRIVRLSDVKGEVQIDRRTGEGFERAMQNLPVTQGTRIWAKEDGRVEIELEDGSTIRLTPNTTIEFTRLGLHESGGKVTELDLSEGVAYFDIDLGKHDDFLVSLGHQSINLEHSARFRTSMDRSQARVAVSHGQVELLGVSSEAVTVSRNRTASFDLFDQKSFDVARDYEESAYDDWNNEQQEYHDRNFERQRDASSNGYGSSDLNYYGSYINSPGYGNLWRPYFASAGWDPFADGSWVWYPGFGYTWVSAYPWGWAPYRYGNWVYIPGGGWYWQPGGGNHWTPVPRVVSAPVGFHAPTPPSGGIGHGPVVIAHGAPVPAAGGPASRFGDPTRRVVREGIDGGIDRNPGSVREAGLGVPRGNMNLGALKIPPAPAPKVGPDAQPTRRGFGDEPSSRPSGSGSVGHPVGGLSGGQSGGPAPAPRFSPPPPAPAPAPRMSPPAPRMSPPAPTPHASGNGHGSR